MAQRAAFRLKYRLRQFWEAWRPQPDPQALAEAQSLLSPALWRLFSAMPLAEQAHGLRVFGILRAAGHTDPDLLTAALLHDVGKARCRPRLWERVVVVLAGWCCPRAWLRWGKGEPQGWRRPFVIAVQHPRWGAALVAAAGASRAAALIREHHAPAPADPLVRVLQWADEQA